MNSSLIEVLSTCENSLTSISVTLLTLDSILARVLRVIFHWARWHLATRISCVHNLSSLIRLIFFPIIFITSLAPLSEQYKINLEVILKIDVFVAQIIKAPNFDNFTTSDVRSSYITLSNPSRPTLRTRGFTLIWTSVRKRLGLLTCSLQERSKIGQAALETDLNDLIYAYLWPICSHQEW